MEVDKILENLTVDDLPLDLKILAEESNLDVVRSILRVWDGHKIQLPKINYMNDVLKRYIAKNIDKEPSILSRNIDRPVDVVRQFIREIKEENQKRRR